MKKALLLISALVLSGTMSAQTEKKNAVVNVENDYTPEVIEVGKKNLTPSDEVKAETDPMELLFSKEGKRYNGFTSQKDINDILPRKEEPAPGYARLGYGITNDIDIKGAYRTVVDNGGRLNVFAGLDGYKSGIDGLFNEWNSRRYRMHTGINYARNLGTMELGFDGSFKNNTFNYQSFGGGVPGGTDKQSGQEYNLAINIVPKRSDALSYSLKGNFEYVARQYSSGQKERIGEGRYGISGIIGYEVLSKWVNDIGADLNLDIFTYNRTLKEKGNGYGNYCSFDIDPYSNLKVGNWKLRAGLKINLITRGRGALAFSPDIMVQNNLRHNVTVYGNFTGGRTNNSFAKLNSITPYWGFAEGNVSRLRPSYRIVDLSLGGRISYKQLSMKASAGYVYTKDDLLEVMEQLAGAMVYANFRQGNTHHLFLDLGVGCDLNGKIKLAADMRFDSWSCKDKNLLIMKPTFAIDLNAEARITKEITMRMGYDFTRYTKDETGNRINNKNNLYARLSYKVNKRLGAYIEGNNLFNSKYYEYAGYMTRGIRASLGLTANF